MDAPKPGDVLDCGHVCPERDGFVTGYARDVEGNTYCYADAEERERKAFATADRYFGYVTADGKSVTTWTGAALARITSLTESRAARKRYVRAVAPDGSQWYGVGPRDSGDYVNLRRAKGR